MFKNSEYTVLIGNDGNIRPTLLNLFETYFIRKHRNSF